MQDERSRTRPGREVGTDVVGDAMVFPQSLKQQAGHARAQVALQQPQGQIIGISMAAAGLPQGQHHLFRVHRCGHDRRLRLDRPAGGWAKPLRRLPMTASGRTRCVG